MNITDIMGMKYNPIYDSWYLSEDTSVNYLGTAIKYLLLDLRFKDGKG